MPNLRILDLGSGPIPKLVTLYTEIDIVSCDNRPSEAVRLQDMEYLTYPAKSFDIVICVNALDHTKNAEKALLEMMRVAKSFIYINCAIDQKTRHGKKHYWDAKADGTLTNGTYVFGLKDYGFEIEFEDGRMIAKCVL